MIHSNRFSDRLLNWHYQPIQPPYEQIYSSKVNRHESLSTDCPATTLGD